MRAPRPGAVPTGRGCGVAAALLALLALALATGTPELTPLVVATAALWASAPVVAGRRGRRARRLVLRVHARPPVGAVGSDMAAELTLHNPTGAPAVPLHLAPLRGRWRRRGRTPGRPAALPLVVPSPLTPLAVPGPGTATSTVLAVPTGRRGVWVLEGATTWVLDPFGLFGAPGPPVPPVRVVVHPRPDRSRPWPPCGADGPAAAAAAGAPAAGRGGLGELAGLRPYVPGDRLRLLHWPTRVRTGAWFVRHFEPEPADGAVLVVDDRAGVHRRADFDAMLGVALGLVEGAAAEGRPVVLGTVSGTRTVLAPPLGLDQARASLAELQPVRHAAATVAPGAVVVTTGTGAARRPAAWAGAPLVVVDR